MERHWSARVDKMCNCTRNKYGGRQGCLCVVISKSWLNGRGDWKYQICGTVAPYLSRHGRDKFKERSKKEVW